MKKNNIFLNKYFKYSLLLIAGIFLGWLFFHTPERAEEHLQKTGMEETTIWTCSMHPQIRMDGPGKCPLCGMDLIPLTNGSSASADPDAIKLSEEAAQLANVQTTVVGRQKPVMEVRLYGKIQVDERLLRSQVAHVPGRIENLTVNFTGETIKSGQVLAEIYSPEMITAQQELLQTLETRQLQPELYEASRERLIRWKLTGEQIDEIEASGKIMNTFKVLSNTSGTVTARNVNTGDYVSQGTVLFGIVDLSRVWALFDAYESDLPFLSIGKKVTFTVQAFPGKEFTGNISFIDPVINPVTRVAAVRVEVGNRLAELKPEMFVTGLVSSELKQYGNDLVIPGSAVLWTGERSIVYVREPGDEHVFKMREITLGPALGNDYIVTSGLSEGEEIVTSGTFSIDASAQLQGKPSMMNNADQNIGKPETNKEFVGQLGKVYDRYIVLKDALVRTDPESARNSSAEVQKILSAVNRALLSGEPLKKWMDIDGILKKHLGIISSSGSVDEQRIAFSGLSNGLYAAIKTFGQDNKIIYYQFCPMAFENKGAYWLSESEDIRNPYFGDQMLSCGETKEVMK